MYDKFQRRLISPMQARFGRSYLSHHIESVQLQVRSNALLESGGSPTWTLTEDFALGMELKKFGWHCRYVQEYLAIGEAPDQIRNCYQQRSRWCKVSFQLNFPRPQFLNIASLPMLSFLAKV